MPRLRRLKPRQIVRALVRAGFVVRRQTGSHIVLRHPQSRRTVVVPYHVTTVGPDLLASILKQAGLSVKDFQLLL